MTVAEVLALLEQHQIRCRVVGPSDQKSDGKTEQKSAQRFFADPQQAQVRRFAPLAGSQPEHLVFFFSRKYQAELASVGAGILVTGFDFVTPLLAVPFPFWGRTVVVAASDPYLAMAVLSEHFAQAQLKSSHLPQTTHSPMSLTLSPPQVHASAVIGDGVQLASGVVIEAHCVVGAGTVIEAGARLYPGCVVGEDCQIGEQSVLFPRVVMYDGTWIGKRVRLHAGCVLGADGFGYAARKKAVDSDGDRGVPCGGHQKIHHFGRVVLGDEVEVGANSTIDRGTIADTRVGDHAKLDNLVHLGHNVQVARGAIVCGGTCVAGNAKLGDFCYIGGMTAIVNHVHVGAGAQVGAQTLLSKDVAAGEKVVGNPQRSVRDHFRVHGWLNRQLKRRGAAE